MLKARLSMEAADLSHSRPPCSTQQAGKTRGIATSQWASKQLMENRWWQKNILDRGSFNKTCMSCCCDMLLSRFCNSESPRLLKSKPRLGDHGERRGKLREYKILLFVKSGIREKKGKLNRQTGQKSAREIPAGNPPGSPAPEPPPARALPGAGGLFKFSFTCNIFMSLKNSPQRCNAYLLAQLLILVGLWLLRN